MLHFGPGMSRNRGRMSVYAGAKYRSWNQPCLELAAQGFAQMTGMGRTTTPPQYCPAPTQAMSASLLRQTGKVSMPSIYLRKLKKISGQVRRRACPV